MDDRDSYAQEVATLTYVGCIHLSFYQGKVQGRELLPLEDRV